MAQMSHCDVVLDVSLQGVEEKRDDDLIQYFAIVEPRGPAISISVNSETARRLRLIEPATMLRMTAQLSTLNGRRRFVRPIFTEIPPGQELTENVFSGFFSGKIDEYEKNGEKRANLLLTCFGTQLTFSDVEIIRAFSRVQNPALVRVEGFFALETRWKNSSNGKYQALEPQFYSVTFKDVAPATNGEGRRRERERPQE